MATIVPPDKTLFGQFLVEEKVITQETLNKALRRQNRESSSVLRDSHRLLGQILFENYNIFDNRIELNKYLEKFKLFKQHIEKMRYEASAASKKKK